MLIKNPPGRGDAVHTPRRTLEVAELEGAGMIVTASHGRTGARRLLMGPVAEQLTRHARIPVTVYERELRKG
jgi:nucleotide-binding universal stress UspA family protein